MQSHDLSVLWGQQWLTHKELPSVFLRTCGNGEATEKNCYESLSNLNAISARVRFRPKDMIFQETEKMEVLNSNDLRENCDMASSE